jgi:hypothetical protein
MYHNSNLKNKKVFLILEKIFQDTNTSTQAEHFFNYCAYYVNKRNINTPPSSESQTQLKNKANCTPHSRMPAFLHE